MSKNQSDNRRLSFLQKITALFSSKPADRYDLLELLRESETRNLLNHDALTMIEGALQVSEMQVRDIMVPRVQMIVVKNDADPEDILATVVESGHSRFPVVGGDTDEITGILMAKDLLNYFSDQENSEFNIKDMMRRAIYVPESKRLNVLLREFRSNRNHMAIVIDEYSGVAGLVTMEDVIEEIVGEIVDEHDIDDEDQIKPHGRNRYTVKALTPIEEFNEFFDTQLSDEEFDTVGGLALKAFGHVPKRGESIEFEGFNVKVLRSDKRRIHLMRMNQIEQYLSDTDSEFPE
ncbi:MAG: CBS domain-containing protein [Proteobacteria bacterium]|nr:CBS domain-containing protein [Pseudomonadota bacterium]MCH9049290.1 CBS domain-containing protein [Pseudomonadota bacterium]